MLGAARPVPGRAVSMLIRYFACSIWQVGRSEAHQERCGSAKETSFRETGDDMSATFTRRTLVQGGALVAATLCFGGTVRAFAASSTPALRPPTAQDEARLFGTCLKCERCRSVCPTNAIRTGLLEDGVLSLRTPLMDFHKGMCDFCGRCAEVCPTGSIRAMSPSLDRIGVALVDEERCIAWSSGSACLVCVEACPTGALALDSSGRPELDQSLCNGCGACEHACPSNSYRAFTGGRLRGINVVPASAAMEPLDGPAVEERWQMFYAEGRNSIAGADPNAKGSEDAVAVGAEHGAV